MSVIATDFKNQLREAVGDRYVTMINEKNQLPANGNQEN